MSAEITARTIVEAVVMDMLVEHCVAYGIAPEDAGIYFSAATLARTSLLRGARENVFPAGVDPMEHLSIDALVGIETASFDGAGTNPDKIKLGTEKALLSAFILVVQTLGELKQAQESRG